jgi:hypothetical protein
MTRPTLEVADILRALGNSFWERQNQPVLVGFRPAYVFDVSQIEDAPLPDVSERVQREGEAQYSGLSSTIWFTR